MNPDDPRWLEFMRKIQGFPVAAQAADASAVARRGPAGSDTIGRRGYWPGQPVDPYARPSGVPHLYGDVRDVFNPDDPESFIMDFVPGIGGIRAGLYAQKLKDEGHSTLAPLIAGAGMLDVLGTGAAMRHFARKPLAAIVAEAAESGRRLPLIGQTARHEEALEELARAGGGSREFPPVVSPEEIVPAIEAQMSRAPSTTPSLTGNAEEQALEELAQSGGAPRPFPGETPEARLSESFEQFKRGPVKISSRTDDVLRELGYDHSPSATPTPGGESPAVAGRQTLHESLPREEAVTKNREYAAAGVPTEMKKNADGTFRIEQKGAGAAKPRLAEKAKKEEKLLSEALTPEERAEYATIQDRLEKHMHEGLERAIAAGKEGRPNMDMWNEARDASKVMRARRDALQSKVDAVAAKAPEGAEAPVGLTPGEANTLRSRRKDVMDITDAIEKYETQIQGTTRDRPDLQEAYEEAQRVLLSSKREIDALKSREHLPPSEAKALAVIQPSTAVTRRGIAGQGVANPAGFQSRLLTAFDLGHQGKALSYDEWMKTLAADPNAPKSELKHVFNNDAAKRHFDHIADADGNIDASDVQKYIEEHAPAQKLETKTLTRDKKTLQRDAEEADDATRELTEEEEDVMRDDMWNRAAEISEERRGRRREELIEAEMEYYREQELTYMRDERIPEALQERDKTLSEIESLVESVFGPESGAKFMEGLSEQSIESGGDLVDGPWWTSDDLGQLGSGDLNDLIDDTNIPDQLDDYIERLRPNPHQLRLGEDMPRVLGQERHTTAEGLITERDIIDGTLADDIRPEMSPENVDAIHSAITEAADKQDDAFRLAKQVDEGDVDEQMIREQAEESADQTLFDDEELNIENIVDELDQADFDPRRVSPRQMDPWTSNTEYHGSQRVLPDAPYREVLIHESGGSVSGGHFAARHNLAAHARGEVHGDTYLMIEAQSDASAKAGSRAKSPFMKVERWTQLSTGGSLRQAAAEGLDHFAWVNGMNANRRATLNADAAKLFYDKQVPAAVKRIFKELDLPMEVETWTPTGLNSEDEANVFQRVKLTPEIREKLLKAGIPALGLAGAAITTRTQKGRSN